MTKFLNISTDNTLGGSSASDVLVSSQKAIKAYVDSKELIAGKDLEIITLLPTGYTKLEYIESDGTQYIDTGIISYKNTDVLKTKVRPTDASGTRFITFQNPNLGTYNIGLFQVGSSVFYQYGSPNRISGTFNVNTDYTLETSNGYLIINGSKTTGTSDSEFTVNNLLLIGAANNNSGIQPDSRMFRGRIYYYKYEDKNGTVLFDGIPAKRTSDGEIGMYDTVSNTFKTNAGTGDFVAGPETTNKVINFTNESGYAKSTDIPTVNNPTITITQGGVTKGSFTLNQASGDTIALDAGGGGGSADIDNLTITENANQKIQAVAVIDQNTGIIKSWSGTGEEYEDISEIDPDTLYITDDLGLPATEIGQITEALNDKVDKGHQVVEFQEPTAENGYIWYRKYADGWVEQGGKIVNNSVDGAITITLPITMANTDYYMRFNPAMATSTGTASNLGAARAAGCFDSQTTTTITVQKQGTQTWAYWEVKGMAA